MEEEKEAREAAQQQVKAMAQEMQLMQEHLATISESKLETKVAEAQLKQQADEDKVASDAAAEAASSAAAEAAREAQEAADAEAAAIASIGEDPGLVIVRNGRG